MIEIAILDASIGETPARENFNRVMPGETTIFNASEGAIPPPVADRAREFDAAIVTGSQCSVYEDRPWIHDLSDWARGAHLHGLPLLGVCWGHQFLVQALGGRVVAMDEYEIGYRSIRKTRPSRLLEGLPETFVAFETHSDRVYALPEGTAVLAENDVCVQAYRLGTTYGVQFHPEYDKETAETVTKRKDDLSDERKETVLAEITPETSEAAKAAEQVFDNFATIVEVVSSAD
ncbi:MAG: type 1 glutamine amidotransferase [Halodesulfurarchaeum sp.]